MRGLQVGGNDGKAMAKSVRTMRRKHGSREAQKLNFENMQPFARAAGGLRRWESHGKVREDEGERARAVARPSLALADQKQHCVE